MDSQFQQDENTIRGGYQQDETMGGTDHNMSSTPTGGYHNDYRNSPRRQSAASEPHALNGSFSPSMDSDPNSRYPQNNSQYQQPQQYSRPSSGLSGGYGHSAYQDQNQRTSHQEQRTQNNVVIKVGMVGDAQIGKTSLMVKYVENSFDEDYIQTLGTEKTAISAFKYKLTSWLQA